MKHVIIGTAGHIDHGKTALIRAMTGRNTDRLTEEQRRGITIDLGFTWFDLADGTRCGIIDVPGHEKFIGNMAAGVVGMDLVLLVVAADEGVMPQTKEHLDIVGLYGVQKTILVFTKCDLVDAEWMDMIETDTKMRLAGTIMEDAPSVRVSSVTGEGIEELKKLILKMVCSQVKERDTAGIPRLPVDRVFTMKGFGTVVTGTLLSGSLLTGEILEIYPTGKTVRIRSIQVHEIRKERCEAGQRTALNLPGIKKEEIRRGFVLAPPGSMEKTSCIDVNLSVLKDSPRKIRNRERLHLFAGTAEILCRAVLLDRDELEAGESAPAQLLCEEDVVVKRGDRFVVRFYSPLLTIGGGTVLEANSRRKKRYREDVLEEFRRKQAGSSADAVELAVRDEKEGPVPGKELARKLGFSMEELQLDLEELIDRKAILAYPLRKDTWYWHADRAFETGQAIVRMLDAFYNKHPYRFGIPRAEIHYACMKSVKLNVFDACIRRMTAEKLLEEHGEELCPAGREIPRDETFLAVEKRLTDAFEQAGYHLLRYSEIEKEPFGEETVADVLRVMAEEGKAVRVTAEPSVYTMKHLMDDAEEKIREHFLADDILTVIQVKDMFMTSRKCAKLIIEYTDSRKITRKEGAETERTAYR